MQYGLKILGTGGYVPPLTVSNEEFAAIADTSDEWIRSRTGIRERHFADGESSLDLAAQAAHRAMDDAGAAPEQIGVVVCATATHEYLFPSLACRVAQALGLPEQVLAFDLNAACSGFLFALHTAQCLLGERRDAYALVIGSEVLSRITDFEDRSTCILFGDGAGAVVAGLGDGGPTLFDSGAIGGTQVLSCPSGLTARNPFASVQELPQRPRIHMDGREVFRFAVDSVSASITRTLAQGGLAPGDVDWYVCHHSESGGKAAGRPFGTLFLQHRAPGQHLGRQHPPGAGRAPPLRPAAPGPAGGPLRLRRGAYLRFPLFYLVKEQYYGPSHHFGHSVPHHPGRHGQYF